MYKFLNEFVYLYIFRMSLKNICLTVRSFETDILKRKVNRKIYVGKVAYFNVAIIDFVKFTWRWINWNDEFHSLVIFMIINNWFINCINRKKKRKHVKYFRIYIPKYFQCPNMSNKINGLSFITCHCTFYLKIKKFCGREEIKHLCKYV